jgi:hypothetical protein
VVYSGDDRTPPEIPVITAGAVDWTAGAIALRWNTPADNVGVARFHVYRSVDPAFTPSAATRLGTTCDARFIDTTVGNFGLMQYRVVAEDYEGNLSAPSAAFAVRVSEE